MVSCWKHGSVKLYLRDFPRFFPNQTTVRDWGYLASELRGSIPLSDSHDGGVLTVNSNFFEFLPEEDADSNPENLLTLDQLAVGRRYYVYVTTLAGLYRYDMNDLVEVTGFYRNTPEIQFIQCGGTSLRKPWPRASPTAVPTSTLCSRSTKSGAGDVTGWMVPC